MKGINKKLWAIAFPLLLNMLISQVQMIIDRAFLGQIDVGYMSALGNVSAPLWTTISILFALSTGGTILMSQALGADDKPRASHIAHAILKYNSAVALLLFFFWLFAARGIFMLMGVEGDILSYALRYVRYLIPIFLIMGINSAGASILQSAGYTRPILISGALRSGLNILLDWILIFGRFGFPEMGIEGAALATSIAELTGTVLLFILILGSRKLPFRISIRKILSSPFKLYKEVSAKGIPTAGEELLWNLGNLGLIRILNAISPLATGIYTIIFTVDIIPALIIISIAQGVTALAGRNTGAGDVEGAKRVGLIGQLNSWGIAALFLVLFFLFPRFILGIFTSDAAIIESSVILLLVAAVNFFPRSVNLIMGSAIRGFGDTKWMLKTQILGTIYILSMGSLAVFVFDLGLPGVFLTILSDETIRGVINYFRFRRGPDLTPKAVQLEETA
ncbi:MAG: MATE family efflux transporter [Spirochaetales bacterium]|nr:MATE family efflux transporter [Spirochaetales bacterium]